MNKEAIRLSAKALAHLREGARKATKAVSSTGGAAKPVKSKLTQLYQAATPKPVRPVAPKVNVDNANFERMNKLRRAARAESRSSGLASDPRKRTLWQRITGVPIKKHAFLKKLKRVLKHKTKVMGKRVKGMADDVYRSADTARRAVDSSAAASKSNKLQSAVPKAESKLKGLDHLLRPGQTNISAPQRLKMQKAMAEREQLKKSISIAKSKSNIIKREADAERLLSKKTPTNEVLEYVRKGNKLVPKGPGLFKKSSLCNFAFEKAAANKAEAVAAAAKNIMRNLKGAKGKKIIDIIRKLPAGEAKKPGAIMRALKWTFRDVTPKTLGKASINIAKAPFRAIGAVGKGAINIAGLPGRMGRGFRKMMLEAKGFGPKEIERILSMAEAAKMIKGASGLTKDSADKSKPKSHSKAMSEFRDRLYGKDRVTNKIRTSDLIDSVSKGAVVGGASLSKAKMKAMNQARSGAHGGLDAGKSKGVYDQLVAYLSKK